MMMRNDPPGRPEVSPSVAGNLVGLRYNPARDRRTPSTACWLEAASLRVRALDRSRP
jgi:hypothetical protein